MLIFFWLQQQILRGRGLDIPAISRITRDLPGFLRMERRPSQNILSAHPSLRLPATMSEEVLSVNVDDAMTLVDDPAVLVGSPIDPIRHFSPTIGVDRVAVRRVII